MSHKLTTCTFCGVGCGIYLETAENKVIGTYPSMSHPANQGRICVRGWNVHEVASSPHRLKFPLIRRNGNFEEASWDQAYDFVHSRMSQILKEHGPEAFGFLNSPRCSNEETYLLQKFARAVIGTNNVDHGASVHRAHSVEVLLDMLGVPAATNSISDLLKSEVIIVDGVDLGRQLPTIGGWVIRAKLNGAKIIVIGARRHRITEHADHNLQIRPGTDLLLYGAMAKIIMDRGLVDLKFVRNHCRDFESFVTKIQAYDVLWVAERCGLAPEQIEEAAIAYASAKAATILYSTGVEARGIDTIRSVVNLALLTGNIGKEGAGIMPLAEHNNLQGGCDMGMLPHRLPGYRLVTDAQARHFFEELWSCSLPSQPGCNVRSMLGNLGNGKLKALWLDRHNPVLTARLCDAEAALEQLDFVVLQHMFLTETAQYADVVLPVVAFGEEEVSFTSTERRIQLARKITEGLEGPVPAWQQIMQLANRFGAKWQYGSASEVMDEIGCAIPFYEAASYDNLARDYGRQWPCTYDRPLGTTMLLADVPKTDQVFKFVPTKRPDSLPAPSAEFPFALVLGYSLYYWHQNVLVQHSETLKREHRSLLLDYPEGFVEINTDDASSMDIRDGMRIQLVGEEGSAYSFARITNEVKKGMVFVPYFLNDIGKQIIGQVDLNSSNGIKQVYVKVQKV
jgi:formate dehydrogenase (coenzyme F420) alpha subunit